MKRILLLLSVIAAFAVPAAAAQANGHTHRHAKRPNLVQLASSNRQLSTLVSLVKRAGLVNALSGTSKLTVFAPTNAAFKKVPKKTLHRLAHNKKLLIKVLTYHVVPRLLPAAKIEHRRTARTLEGQRLRFRVRHDRVYVNRARIIRVNLRASNGIVHVINRVLIP